MPPLSAVGISGLQAGEDVNQSFAAESMHHKYRAHLRIVTLPKKDTGRPQTCGLSI